MKKLSKIILLLSFCFGLSVNAFDQSQYNVAQEIFKDRKEICFSFFIRDMSELNKLPLYVNVDRITNNEVKAYAFKEPFEEFVKLGYDFEILSPLKIEEPPMYLGRNGEVYGFDKYPAYSAYVDIMKKFETDYPELCKLEYFGKSIKGKDYIAAIVTKNPTADAKKPKVFLFSSIHGDELCGMMLSIRMANLLLSSYGKDDRITKILDSIEVWINPLGNPDGTYAGGDNSISGATRANSRGSDLNRTFEVPNPDPADAANKLLPAEQETKLLIEFDKKQKFVLAADFHGGAEVVVYPWGSYKKRSPDDDWWQYISKKYVETARKVSDKYLKSQFPSGITNGSDWYIIQGERMNNSQYYYHCRAICLEVSTVKPLAAAQFDNYWSYNKDAILEFIEESLNGIRGTVTDSSTGKAIVDAKITIPKKDKDGTEVYSKETFGDFYRPIKAGSYDLEITATGYNKKTITGVQVTDGKPTILNIKMLNPSNIAVANSSIPGINFHQTASTVTINNGSSHSVGLTVFDVAGKAVYQSGIKPYSQFSLLGKNGVLKQLGSGYYFVSLNNNQQSMTRKVLLAQ